ncbi:hypothetical protein Tco_0225026, partial [Tanacetum coccineum]
VAQSQPSSSTPQVPTPPPIPTPTPPPIPSPTPIPPPIPTPTTSPIPTPTPPPIPSPIPIPDTKPTPFEHIYEESSYKDWLLLLQQRRYKRRKEAKGKKVVSSLDFQEEVDAGAEQVNTAEGLNTSSIKLSTASEQLSTVSAKKSTSSHDKGQREGKAPMISEETPKKPKEQILQEEASLAEVIRLDSLQKEEEAKQIHL